MADEQTKAGPPVAEQGSAPPAPATPSAEGGPGYFPVHLSLLLRDKVTAFDIYLAREGNRHVLYREAGILFTEEVQKELLANGVENVYISREGHAAFMGYLENHLPALIRKEEIAVEEKVELVSLTTKHLAEAVFLDPDSPEPIRRARRGAESMADLLLREPKAFGLLMRLTTYDFFTFTHSINVCTVALGLSARLYRDDPQHDLRMLAQGFILHDIGKVRIPPEVLQKEGPLSLQEWALMRRHPEEGCAILEKHGPVPDAVRAIVLQHHERADGGGYPRGLRGEEIHPYARMCYLANAFDALTTKRPYRRVLSTFEALKLMKKELRIHFDAEMFQQFVLLFQG